MNKTTEQILRVVSGFTGKFEGAFNIREDGKCAGRQSSKNIKIESKEDGPGLVIHIKPNTKDEKVYIPACVTHGAVDDLVYNDFYVGENADVNIVAGCGVHTDDGHDARHNGIHRFFLEENAHVLYEEKHIATGKGGGLKRIDPVTDVNLKKGAVLEMDTIQLEGVDSSIRKTGGVLEEGAKLLVRERIMTDGEEKARTDFDVVLKGENAKVDLISRSVAKGNSYQEFNSKINGETKCKGHSECDAILVDNGSVSASPSLIASDIDAELIHEAAIGKIAGEQILKLQSLGLTKEEAEQKIISGFLK
ncbi:SufB/SufD family protein [Anaerofustis stercorihominis]|uniref:SufD family Fe-S cluster assembly protein n=1 Tax=Anaerofustis stercorihominis TaxID=214853 RepID=A0A3E3E0V8_9FIRM|nr:SufD family Fe-S cluster assembly protein [Anaerofustis stercorihominis]RGD75184.1 SufD family Fe-S cluster assembly protein [Anaerofustis stercorihominis]